MALHEFNKESLLQQLKSSLKQLNPEQVEVECLVKPPEKPDGLEFEMDEIWRSYFGKKGNPHWLWQDKRSSDFWSSQRAVFAQPSA